MSTRWLTLYQKQTLRHQGRERVLDVWDKALLHMVSDTLTEAEAEILNDTLVNV